MHVARGRPSTRCPRVLVASVLATLVGSPVFGQSGTVDISPSASSPQRFSAVPDFSFTERSGRTVTRDDLLGEPWVAVPFFASCTGPCPQLTADLRRNLYDALARTDARIVSITVDPDYDTPEILREYADNFTVDSDRWLFLTGPKDEIHDFVRNGLALAVQEPTQEDADELDVLLSTLEITHATRLPVIDAAGRIAGWYDCGSQGQTREEVEASVADVLARLRYLDGRPPHLSPLPLVNASLNGVAFVLLVAGWLAIRRGKRDLHAGLMRAAFASSVVFLASYLYYHFVVIPDTGPTRYNGTGWRKGAYLAMLLSHVVLAAVNLPMVLWTLWLAHHGDWERHRRMARRTLPIWLYVSVTGVLVYVVLYPMNPAPPID